MAQSLASNLMSAPPPRFLSRLSAGYAVLWMIALVLWRSGDWLPEWLLAMVFTAALPLGALWIRWLRGSPNALVRAAGYSALYPFAWQLVVFWAQWLRLGSMAGNVANFGAAGLFLIGLGWVVWGLERAARRIELSRIDRLLEQGPALAGPAIHLAEQRAQGTRIWNPLDPLAWYYGRRGQKLKQSTLVLFAYVAAFWLAVAIVGQLGGCRETYELPAGGGQQKTVAQKVRIQKVVRKKFVINPLSAIKFEVPPIDEVKLQLQEVTAHEYTIGYGEGTGAGFAGGTQKGKVRLIRLEYDGGDWDLNFGPGGDMNMLFEYGLLTRQKVAEQTESRRIAQLASFPPDKSPPVVFVTGQGSLSLSNSEIKTLREYLLDKHGMLFASSGSRHFHNQFVAAMNRILPDVRPVPVPLDDTIHRVPFAVPFLPYVVPHGGKDALGWSRDGRWLVYYHPGDISDAWADGHAGVSPEVYNSCYQLGANVLNYGHVEYSKWLTARQSTK